MRRILEIGGFLWPTLPGGAEVAARELAVRLIADGMKVDGLSSSINNPTTSRDVTYLRTGRWVRADQRLHGFEKYLFYIFEQLDVVTGLKVYRRIAKSKPDLIIIHSWRGLGVWTPFAVVISGVPAIFVLHDFALVCMNKAGRTGNRNCEAQCLLCRLSSLVYLPLLRRSGWVRLVAPAEAHGREVENLARGRLRLSVIPYPATYEMISRERRPMSRLVFGYIGRLESVKGFETFLALASAFQDRADFLVAGSGDMQRDAELAANSKVIKYLGLVSRQQLAETFDQFDVLLVPSTWRGNYPGVCVQAMLAGAPVIGSNIGGIPEIIQDKVTGRLVAPEDVGAWHRTVADLIADPAIVSSYSKNALADRARFDPSESYEKYRSIMADMVQ
jgi:glycosyltransferase involved in cell wall biosynthesis